MDDFNLVSLRNIILRLFVIRSMYFLIMCMYKYVVFILQMRMG